MELCYRSVISVLLISLLVSTVRAQTRPVAVDDFLLVVDGLAKRVYQFYTNGTLVNNNNMGRETTVLAVDYDPILKRIFWSDIETTTLNSMELDGTDKRIILQLTAASSPEGLAVDPQLKLLFYSDSGLGRLCVIKYTGQDHKIIVPALPKPRDVHLDRVRRYVYWTDWKAEVIKRSRYDGSSVETIVMTEGTWFNGLVLDVPARTMYYTDASNDIIYKANMDDGSRITQLVTTLQFNASAIHPYGITKIGGELYFTDWTLKEIVRLDLASGNVSELSRVSFLRLHGIVAYSSRYYDQASTTTPCIDNNGGCSDLCLPLDGDVDMICACPDGLDLLSDGHTCTPVDPNANGPDVIWVEHDGLSSGYVRGIKGEPSDFMQLEEVDTWSFRNPDTKWTAVDFSYDRRLLFLVDQETKSLYEMQLNNSLFLGRVQFGLSSQVNGIAYDWYVDAIYWTDALFNWIKVVQRGTPHVKTLITGLDQPHDIVVHPKQGKMFWTDWGRNPRIEAANLQGKNRYIVITSNVNRPTGITCDFDNDLLYWADVDGVHSCTFAGQNVRDYGGADDHSIADITFFNGFIVAASMGTTPELRVLNANTPGQQMSKSLNRRPSGVTMYHTDRQKKPDVWIWNDCRRCEHLCLTKDETGITCVCSDGYTTNNNAQTCIDSNTATKPMFVYSAGNRICSISAQSAVDDGVNPQSSCFFTSDQYDFRALDFDYKNGLLYFADIRSQPRTIRRVNLNVLHNNSIVVTGVGQVYGLAIDWISDNLYWCDFDMGQIWVSRANGAYQKILIKNVNKPQTLILDLRRRHIFWTEPGKIRRASLDGSNITNFITSNVANVTGLTIRYNLGFDDRLYWTNAAINRVESVLLDGLNRQQMASHPEITQMYGVAIIEDHMALTAASGAENTHGIHVTDIPEGESPTQITHFFNDKLYDIVAYYDRNQPQNIDSGPTSCVYGNTVCDQLCLQNATTYQCACIDGMRYDPQQSQCVSNSIMEDNFLLIADDYRHSIYQVHPEDVTQVSAVKVPPLDRPLGLAYDHLSHTIFYTEFKTSNIKKTDLHSNSERATVLKRAGQRSRIDGIAVDVLSQLLYYTDTGRDRIGVLTYDGRHDKTLLTSANFSNLQNPRAIVLDTARGHMYFTVRYPDQGGIMRADMDGKNPRVILNHISWPNGLDIDIPGSMLYYVDGHSEVVAQVGLNGSNHRTIHSSTARADPFGVAKVGNFVYWTDWFYKGIFRVNIENGAQWVIGDKFFLGLNDIIYFKDAQSRILGSDACSGNRIGCSEICIPTPGGVTCACGDRSTDCQHVSYCQPLAEVAHGTISPPNCTTTHQIVGSVCHYKCNSDYALRGGSSSICHHGRLWSEHPVCQKQGHCASHPCKVGQCEDFGDRFECYCWPGWTGELCETEIDECESNPCVNNATCVDKENRYQCECATGYTGTHCESDVSYCQPLAEVAHGTISPPNCTTTHQIVGSVCHYKCNSDYALRGGSSSICHHGRLWSEHPVCQKQGSTAHATKKKNTEGIAVPVAVSVLLLIFLAAALLLAVIFVLKRKSTKKGARYRDNTQRDLQGTDATPPLPSEEINPSYDVKQDSVNLDGSRSFENPLYKNLNEVKTMKQDMKPIEEIDAAQADPLPAKSELSENDVTIEINSNISKDQLTYGYDVNVENPRKYDVVVSDGSEYDVTNEQRTAFTNPMYERVTTPAGAQGATVSLDNDAKTTSES